MNIAVIFTKGINEGGAFQYAVSITRFLQKNKTDAYNFIFFSTLKENINLLKRYDIAAIYLPWSDFDRLKSLLLGSQLAGNIFTRMKMRPGFKLDKIFKRHRIDLVYFLSPTDLALALNRYNYIFTVWDLCFMDSMEFPEVYANREFDRREKLYRLAMAKAVAVITDSELNRAKIIKRYGINEDRVVYSPFVPLNALSASGKNYSQNFTDINKKYNIDGKYIFYPAQFWPHKNHKYILDGIKIMKEKYKMKINVVFSGSDKGNLSFILKKAEEFGIADQIHYIGFVEDKELSHLYAQALALVMPTYFGPTNIPPLEAFAVGCPVLYSDLAGLREQVEGSVILLDLNNPDTMCRGLLKIIKRSPEIDFMIENGKKKIESITLMQKRYMEELKNVLEDYSLKLNTWKQLFD